MPSQPAPNRSLPSSRPTIAAGLDTGWNGSFGGSLDACATHQFYAVDLDIRNSLFAPSESRMGAVSSTLPVRIRSAWIPGAINGPIAGRRADSLWAFLDDAVQDHGLRTVIVPRSAEISHGAFIGAELRKRMQAIAGSGVRLAIGVKAAVMTNWPSSSRSATPPKNGTSISRWTSPGKCRTTSRPRQPCCASCRASRS
jgi:hypothetical protein